MLLRIPVFLLLVMLTNCSNDDLPVNAFKDNSFQYEESQLKGYVRLLDDYTEEVKTVAPNATVYLTRDTTLSKYLYSVKADADGIFSFAYLPKTKGIDSIYVISKYTNTSNSVPYIGKFLIKNPSIDSDGNVELLLKPLYPLGILKIKLLGILPNKEPLSGTDIYLFTNKDQAATITETISSGIVDKKTTNAQGIAFFYNLKKNTYYVQGKLSKATTTLYSSTTTVVIDDNLSQSKKSPNLITTLTL